MDMEFQISQEEQQVLLMEAREILSAALENRMPVFNRNAVLTQAIEEGRSALAIPCGAFVTINKDGALRGCIGRLIASESLERTVHAMTIEAAFGDPRFPPLTAGELGNCTIEISALSPLAPCNDPQSVEVGVHGLYLVHRGRSGVLLPQVPVEQGWNLDEYLAYICIKAGLPPRSYEAIGANLYTFTAVVFGE